MDTKREHKGGSNSAMIKLIVCAVIFAAAAGLKAVLPDDVKARLTYSLDTGLTVREVVSTIGEAASDTQALKRLWDGGVLRVFGLEPAQETQGDAQDDEPDISVIPAQEDTDIQDVPESSSVLGSVAFDPANARIDIDAGELPVTQTTDEQALPDNSEDETEAESLPDIVSTEEVSFPFEYVTPVTGPVTSPFGWREHPIDGEYKFHYGIDIGADEGTDVECFADGRVIFAGVGEINGNYIKVEHDDGFVTLYAHLSKILVSWGDTVECGQTIGLVGETGEASGPHLHFQIYSNGYLIDPEPYLTLLY